MFKYPDYQEPKLTEFTDKLSKIDLLDILDSVWCILNKRYEKL